MENKINEQQIDYSADAQLVISELEAIHPMFLLDEVPASYEKYKAEYIEFTSKAITLTEFRLATQKCLAILGDGHISIGLALNRNSLYIDVAWVANDGKLYLLDENNKPTNVEIINIGGIAVNKVTEQVDIYNAAENEASRQHNYAMFCRQEDMLKVAGCKYTDSDIELKTSDGQKMICKLISSDGFTIWLGSKAEYIIRHEMMGDVFYIDLRTFQPDPSVDETAEKIKTAVQDSVTKFIIDIRDNSGGNSDVGDQLVKAMGMAVPNYGCFVRNSKRVFEQNRNMGDEESGTVEPDLSRAVTNEKITLLVLTNINTFSSATMLGVWVQDGKLGKIVGQTSSNKPNAYGDMIGISLPVSKINFSISHKRFLRPDTSANPDSLIPDIEVPFGEDILAVALDYMSG